MLRSIYAAAACAAVAAVVSQGCNRGGVGDPCIPEQEFDTRFLGFDPGEVNVESHSFQCLTRLCLVNHFRGRVTCPYGQNASGTDLPCTDGETCGTPGQGAFTPCVPPGASPAPGNVVGGIVHPQCSDRTADNVVYCSCRCANGDGRTDDGANYCACPDAFECAPLVDPIGAGDQNLAGSYCIKKGTAYKADSACMLPCDPNAPGQSCPPSSIL
jgi:hypothetical protein